MELTKEHIGAYWPYEVKIQWSDGRIGRLIGLSKMPEDNAYFDGGFDALVSPEYELEVNPLQSFTAYPARRGQIKLLLRPLSDLTKEIEHNGERFTPIDKLFDRPFPIYTRWQDREGYHIGHGKEFDMMVTTIRKDLRVAEWWIIKKLHSWHFDTFGLIEAGLAIDINTTEG